MNKVCKRFLLFCILFQVLSLAALLQTNAMIRVMIEDNQHMTDDLRRGPPAAVSQRGGN